MTTTRVPPHLLRGAEASLAAFDALPSVNQELLLKKHPEYRVLMLLLEARVEIVRLGGVVDLWKESADRLTGLCEAQRQIIDELRERGASLS